MVYTIDKEKQNFAGIGKMIIQTSLYDWNIPPLHFLVRVMPGGSFESYCLEFGLVSGAENIEEAVKSLAQHTLFYINAVMTEGGGYEELKEVALNGFMNDYWNAYRHIEFCLAEQKRDLSHELDYKTINEIADNKSAACKFKSVKYCSLEARAA